MVSGKSQLILPGSPGPRPQPARPASPSRSVPGASTTQEQQDGRPGPERWAAPSPLGGPDRGSPGPRGLLRPRGLDAGNSRAGTGPLPPRPGAKPARQPRRPAFAAPSFRPACPAPSACRVISRSRRQDVRDATAQLGAAQLRSPSPLAGREVSMGHPQPPPLPPPPPSAASMAKRKRRSASSVTQVDLASAGGGGAGGEVGRGWGRRAREGAPWRPLERGWRGDGAGGGRRRGKAPEAGGLAGGWRGVMTQGLCTRGSAAAGQKLGAEGGGPDPQLLGCFRAAVPGGQSGSSGWLSAPSPRRSPREESSLRLECSCTALSLPREPAGRGCSLRQGGLRLPFAAAAAAERRAGKHRSPQGHPTVRAAEGAGPESRDPLDLEPRSLAGCSQSTRLHL